MIRTNIFALPIFVLALCDITSSYSGYDGVVRVWNIPNRTHQFLQQTCIFNCGEGVTGEHLDGQLLDNLCWNNSGKLLAASMDNMVNIWGIGGKQVFIVLLSLY